MNIRLLCFYADFEGAPTMSEWKEVFRPECHRSYRTHVPSQSIAFHPRNQQLYTDIFNGWIDDSSEYLDDIHRATWITAQTPILRRVVADYGQVGLSMFATNPQLYTDFTRNLYQLRSRMSTVQRAIQARVAPCRFSPLLVLQLEWKSLCPDAPVTVGDLLVGLLTASSFTEPKTVNCNRFGSFFAALYVYLELSRLLVQAWKIHEVLEREDHASSRRTGELEAMCVD